MATLNEYLGTLVSNFSQARVLADLESAKIAELYASDGILKHFSIPRMRIDDVELTIPVAIDELSIKNITKQDLPDPQFIRSSVYTILLQTLERSSLPQELSLNIRKEISDRVEIYSQDRNKKNLELLLNTLPDSVGKQIDKSVDFLKNINESVESDRTKLEIKKREASQSIAVLLKKEIEKKDIKEEIKNLHVTMESARLKDKNKNNLVFIKMKISEESMEWETMEDADGNIIKKLMQA